MPVVKYRVLINNGTAFAPGDVVTVDAVQPLEAQGLFFVTRTDGLHQVVELKQLEEIVE